VDCTDLLTFRRGGDAAKAREYLPKDKQYLFTGGVPCLRRATSLAYTDADEDAERLVSFGDSFASGNEADDWVETHAGRKATTDSAANAGDIADIPDLDGPSEADGIATGIGRMSLAGAKAATADAPPDLDDIPDMEEEGLEAEDDEATAAPTKGVSGVPASGILDARFASPTMASHPTLSFISAKSLSQMAIFYKFEHMMS
jgi:ubiquitin-like-conjugating enzyme ATG3